MSSRSDLVIGALVADAAAMGLHWIYDVDRVREVGGDEPEFMEPDLAHYKGVPAYFAHKGKKAGDPTHYGEQLIVAVESLEATEGKLDVIDYERRYCDHFGPGGSWVGYIDYATRETLRNIDDAERNFNEVTKTMDLGEYESDRPHIVSAVMANVMKWKGAKLDAALAQAVKIRVGEDDILTALTQEMGKRVRKAVGGFHGSDDMQLPAIASLPAVVAHGADVEAAVRTTHNTDEAVKWAQKVAALLRFEIEPGELAGNGGPACPLDQAIPVCGRILAEASSFEAGVRANILEGGDNAGRGLVIGAYLGKKFGVPDEWVRLTNRSRRLLT